LRQVGLHLAEPSTALAYPKISSGKIF
jgi:hypothetical protein